MNILVVDDSLDSRELTEGVLLSAGYKDVHGASSAAEAFKLLGIGEGKAHGTAADIVLLDIVMPDIDGIEACARIRSDQRYEDVPIIMVTALDDMDNLANAFIAGANDYITKPINRIELTARVRAALKLKSELEQRRRRERELLDFMASWGDRRATNWIDEATGLFVGEVAEAYLNSCTRRRETGFISVIALKVDRLEQVSSAQGDAAARAIQARVAAAIRSTAATIGVLAASYRNGLIVIVAPDFSAAAAQKLAHALRAAVAGLAITNREFVAADHATASAAVVTGRVGHGSEGTRLLLQAITGVQRDLAEGGDRITSVLA
jgi:PleD family two-component response regulator